MAPSSTNEAAARVIHNEDLLYLIAPHLDRKTMASLRLSNRILNDFFTKSLFHTITHRTSASSVQRLHDIASYPRLASAVRELVWDTASYLYGQKDMRCTSRDVRQMWRTCGLPSELRSPEAERRVLERLQNETRDEMKFLRGRCLGTEMHDMLVDVLGLLTGLHTLRLTTWPGDKDGYFSDDALLCQNGAAPPPWCTLLDRSLVSDSQDSTLFFLFHASCEANIALTSLVIEPADMGLASQVHTRKLMPTPMLPSVSMLDAQLSMRSCSLTALRNLKHMRLDLGGEDSDMELASMTVARDMTGVNMGYLWQAVPNLEHLDLRIRAVHQDPWKDTHLIKSLADVFSTHTFSRLSSLTLRSFWLEPDDLCAFLAQHASGLRALQLDGVNLSNPHHAPGLFMRHDVGYVAVLPAADRSQDVARAVTSHPGWEQVADACRTFPVLEQVCFKGASAMEEFSALSVFEVEELTEVALAGRRISSNGDEWFKIFDND